MTPNATGRREPRCQGRHLWMLLASAGILMLPGRAEAIGLCEDVQSTSRLVEVDAASSTFLLEGQHGWCSGDDDTYTPDDGGDPVSVAMGEQGEVPYVEIVDETRSRVAILRLAEGQDWLKAWISGAGDLLEDAGDRQALATYRGKHAFAPVARFQKSPRGRCGVRIREGAASEDEGGFPANAFTLEVRAGKQVLLRAEFEALQRLSAQPIFLPARRTLFVWREAVECSDGGPPPGYFGEDDPGDCYELTDVELHKFTLGSHPALAQCFAPLQPGELAVDAGVADAGVDAAVADARRPIDAVSAQRPPEPTASAGTPAAAPPDKPTAPATTDQREKSRKGCGSCSSDRDGEVPLWWALALLALFWQSRKEACS